MLHVSLDKYGLLALTASLTTLREIVALVEEQNWQERIDRGGQYIRFFDVCQFPTVAQLLTRLPSYSAARSATLSTS